MFHNNRNDDKSRRKLIAFEKLIIGENSRSIFKSFFCEISNESNEKSKSKEQLDDETNDSF